MRGAFITLEGGEGVGKSTNLTFVAETLKAAGRNVLTTREPGGTPFGERIRGWILDGDHGRVVRRSRDAADVRRTSTAPRSGHSPALESGRWVICDRFTDATFAYQGGGRGADLGLLRSLRAEIQRDLEPDLTLLLDAPLEVGSSRIAARTLDHFEREQRPFFERVRNAYLQLAAENPGRIRIVDAAQPLSIVQTQIAAELDALRARFQS